METGTSEQNQKRTKLILVFVTEMKIEKNEYRFSVTGTEIEKNRLPVFKTEAEIERNRFGFEPRKRTPKRVTDYRSER